MATKYSDYPGYSEAFNKVAKLDTLINGIKGRYDSGLAYSVNRIAEEKGENSAAYRKAKAQYDKAKADLTAAKKDLNAIKVKAEAPAKAEAAKKEKENAAKKETQAQKDLELLQYQYDSARRLGDTAKMAAAEEKIKAAEAAKSSDVLGTGTTSGLTIEQANKNIDSMIKNAKQSVFDMNGKGARSSLAQQMTDAGYYEGPITDTYRPDLATAYATFLAGAKAYNAQNTGIAGFTPIDPKGFLEYRTTGAAGGAGVGGGDVYTPQAQRTNQSEAASIINDEVKTATGRDATPAEVKALTAVLNKIESANPLTRSGSKGGKYEYAGGVKAAEIVRQLITDPENTSFGRVDKKTVASIVKTVNKLGLNTIAAQRKADKTAIALDDIKKTAIANGLPMNQKDIEKYTARLKAGEDAETIKKSIRTAVAGMFAQNKHVTDLLAAGNDLDDVYAPYRTVMASVLELPSDKIDVNDPTLTRAISSNGNMPLYEFKNALRADSRWQYTDNARETVSNGLTQVLKDFGFMG